MEDDERDALDDLLMNEEIQEEQLHLLNLQESLKTKPPFTNLQIFNACALILGYFGFTDQVFDLLQMLSKQTRHYLICHKEILRGFVIDWPTEAKAVISFGGEISNTKREKRIVFPEGCNFLTLPRWGQMKLCAINYKNYDNFNEELCGI